MENLIKEVKKKREFSGLPDSIVQKALENSDLDVKVARNFLRKYFGIFLTNKVLKGTGEDLLSKHISSKDRDYNLFYKKIFENILEVGSVIDIGCGVNGFSYNFLSNIVGNSSYIGVEASGQLVEKLNSYFEKENLSEVCNVYNFDLFDINRIKDLLKKSRKNRVVFLFQVIDAVENIEKNFSKRLILEIFEECEFIVISLPLRSLGGKTKFNVQRKWLMDFLEEKFLIEKDFVLGNERIIIVRKK